MRLVREPVQLPEAIRPRDRSRPAAALLGRSLVAVAVVRFNVAGRSKAVSRNGRGALQAGTNSVAPAVQGAYTTIRIHGAAGGTAKALLAARSRGVGVVSMALPSVALAARAGARIMGSAPEILGWIPGAKLIGGSDTSELRRGPRVAQR